jgi:hypothetical protein
MSIHTLCKPRSSVHAADRRATVLNLDTFLKGQVGGAEFFEENYFHLPCSEPLHTPWPKACFRSTRYKRATAILPKSSS